MSDRFKKAQPAQKSLNKQSDIISDSIDRELFIDENNINKEIMDQPLLMRKWTRLKAEVSKQVKLTKAKLDIAEAKCAKEVKLSAEKITVKDIDIEVKLNPEVQSLKIELIENEHLLDTYDGIVRAFHQRHDSLKDIAANRRKELL
jgi:hypothetical protein